MIEDLGKRCISAVSRALGICREKVINKISETDAIFETLIII